MQQTYTSSLNYSQERTESIQMLTYHRSFICQKRKKKVGELKNRLKDRGRESGISAAGQSHYIIQR